MDAALIVPLSMAVARIHKTRSGGREKRSLLFDQSTAGRSRIRGGVLEGKDGEQEPNHKSMTTSGGHNFFPLLLPDSYKSVSFQTCFLVFPSRYPRPCRRPSAPARTSGYSETPPGLQCNARWSVQRLETRSAEPSAAVAAPDERSIQVLSRDDRIRPYNDD